MRDICPGYPERFSDRLATECTAGGDIDASLASVSQI